MAMAIWAKPVAETNLSFVKGFGKALKTWRELFQQTFLRKPKTKVKGLEISHVKSKERCLFQLQPSTTSKHQSSLQSRIFQALFSKTTSRSLASQLRRQSALRLSSSPINNFRHVPIMSLVGVTLGVNLKAVMDDGNERMMSEIREKFQGFTFQTERLEKVPTCLDDLDIHRDRIIDNGCEGAVYMARVKAEPGEPSETIPESFAIGEIAPECQGEPGKFDLAVKAVFNYGAESNADCILREMEKEIVPLRPEGCGSTSELGERINRLPPHPNIVDMPGYFVDDMLVTEEGLEKFPAAMPRRLNKETCYGRNKTLYLIMRRRASNLREFLARPDNQLTMSTRCLMLAQLLEGVAHMNQHGVAHRDLKTNNILVEHPSENGVPRLEICDFGRCLAEENGSLVVSYPSRDLSLGGNAWLMAPEISSAVPGPQSLLDFRKTDLWAVGAIAYEILGGGNPFYPCQDNSRQQLSSRTYSHHELPSLPEDVPASVRRLVSALLSPDPCKRPSARVASAVVQMAAFQIQEEPANRSYRGRRGHNKTPALKGGRPVGGRKRRQAERQTGWKGEESRVGYNKVVAEVRKQREMLKGVLGKSLALVCQLTFGGQSAAWNMETVTNFLLLSRLSYADFKEATKFFLS